jgi:hypothetical protein
MVIAGKYWSVVHAFACPAGYPDEVTLSHSIMRRITGSRSISSSIVRRRFVRNEQPYCAPFEG